jgi:hypothetical protein
MKKILNSSSLLWLVVFTLFTILMLMGVCGEGYSQAKKNGPKYRGTVTQSQVVEYDSTGANTSEKLITELGCFNLRTNGNEGKMRLFCEDWVITYVKEENHDSILFHAIRKKNYPDGPYRRMRLHGFNSNGYGGLWVYLKLNDNKFRIVHLNVTFNESFAHKYPRESH